MHTGAEIDLIFHRNSKLWGIEFKFTDTPKTTPSIKSAIEELNLEHVWIINPGNKKYQLSDKLTVTVIIKISNLFN